MTEKNSGGWAPVGMSAALANRGVLRVVVEGRDIVVWRGEDGAARAWENRCPHRGMRLSYGFVRGNRLTCLYHGWGYNGDGACVSIPAHPTLTPPRTIKVTRYDCREASGLVWVAVEGANDPLDAPEGDWLPVQTIDLDVPLDDARMAVVSAGPAADRPSFGGTAGDTADRAPAMMDGAEANGAGSFVVFDDPYRGRKVLCGFQPVGDDRTAVHILVAAGAAAEGTEDRSAMQRAYAQWGRRIRRGRGQGHRDRIDGMIPAADLPSRPPAGQPTAP